MEWIWYGLAVLTALSAVSAFARYGLTGDVLASLTAAAFVAGLGGFTRNRRKVAEFKERYPGWREYDFLERRR